MSNYWKNWIKAAGIRAIKTVAQTAIATIGTSAVIGDVNWVRSGTKITKWRCSSCNKTDGHKVCSNRYVTDETFTKLFIMGWNEIAEHPEDYQEKWEANIKSDDVLLRYKTRLLMKHVEAGPIKEFDSALMMAVMDHITVYEDGRLKIRFYDETEFEVTTE